MSKAKSTNKIKLDAATLKKPIEASNLFHNIMKASVTKDKKENKSTK